MRRGLAQRVSQPGQLPFSTFNLKKPKVSAGEWGPLLVAPSNCTHSAGWKGRRGEGAGMGPALPGAHLRPRHCPLCHWPVERVWAAFAHSAGTVPGGSRVGGSGLAGVLEGTGTGQRKAHLHEVLAAVGRSAALAVAHHHLCQQLHIVVHLLDGTHPLRDFLHPLLVLGRHQQMAPGRPGQAQPRARPTPLWTVSVAGCEVRCC